MQANLWHMNMDEMVWPEPKVFKPERFLDENGKFMYRKELMPFGRGRFLEFVGLWILL